MVAGLEAVRAELAASLDWHHAHADFDTAVEGLPAELRGRTPAGLPYSAWQLVEHLRLAQHDILDFCINPAYRELRWPDDYWPTAAAPPSDGAWEESLAGFRRDRDALRALAQDPAVDLLAPIPHGSGQTLLRELLLVLDHNAYHLGQLLAVRRLLGALE
ncbi:MAG TPA: DinB family protein [Gemmatimonadales bacterium]|nr:DinB family protein [Gemmatimonadales bacterium]